MAKTIKTTAPKASVSAAAVTLATVIKVGTGFADAVSKAADADGTFFDACVKAARLIKVPLSAAQYDAQVGPQIRKALADMNAARVTAKKPALAETTLASQRSRFKTFALAYCCGDKALKPQPGDTTVSYLGRVSAALGKVKLPNGQPVWPADGKKAGRAAGTTIPKPAAHAPGAQLSAGSVNDREGGLDVKPAMAAALILTKGDASLASRLVIVLQSYRDDFSKWTSTILTDADKAELGKLQPSKADATPPKAKPVTSGAETAMGAALIQGQAKLPARKVA
jgi:hypothetical protein